MKPNTSKPTKTPSNIKSYVLQRKLDILLQVYYMIANTKWYINQSDALDDLLDKFIELSKDLGEEKVVREMKLKNILKNNLTHPKNK